MKFLTFHGLISKVEGPSHLCSYSYFISPSDGSTKERHEGRSSYKSGKQLTISISEVAAPVLNFMYEPEDIFT